MEKLALLKKQLTHYEDYGFHEIQETFTEVLPDSFEDLTRGELNEFLQATLDEERYELWQQLSKLLIKYPYSQSYYRRSYRAPQSPKKHTSALLTILLGLVKKQPIELATAFSSKAKEMYVNGGYYYVNEKDEPLISQDFLPYLVALKLNANDAQIEEFIREILWKNGAHPMYSKYVVKGILMSDRSDLYVLVGDVLLAAKNQEGARQVIVETIDEGTLQAQLYFMELILQHDLTRFSSVVRAVDVWFGLGYEAKNKKEIHYILTESLAALKDDAHREHLLQSTSSLDVFIGIWVLATRNVEDVLTRLDELMTRKKHVQQTVLYALHHMEIAHLGKQVYPYMLETTELHTFLYGFRFLVDMIPNRYYFYRKDNPKALLQTYFDERPWLLAHAETWLEKLETFSAKIKGEHYEIESKPFPFLHVIFKKQQFFELRILLLCMLERTEELKQLAEEVPTWPVDAREYFYYYVPMSLEQYDYLLPALQDRSIGIRKHAIDTLAEVKYPLEQFKALVPKLLTLKTGEIRQALITLLTKQPIEEIEQLAAELLKSKKEAVRIGTLELLITVREQLTQDYSARIANPTEKEQQLLGQLATQQETFATQLLPAIHDVITPNPEITFTFKQLIGYDFSALKEKLMGLVTLIEAHQDVSYPVENYWGEQHEVLIGQDLMADARKAETIGSIDHLVLSEHWTEWLVASDLTDEEICVFLYMRRIEDSYFLHALTAKGKAFIQDYFGDTRPEVFLQTFKDLAFKQQLSTIMQYTIANGTAPLQQKVAKRFATVDYVQFCASMLRELHATVPMESGMYDSYGSDNLTIDIYLFGAAFHEMQAYARTPEQIIQLLKTTALFYGEDIEQFQFVSNEGLLKAFEAGIIDERHVRRLLVSKYFSRSLSEHPEHMKSLKKFACYEAFEALIGEVGQFIVEQELARGDLETPVTKYVHEIGRLDAGAYFVRLMKELGKEKLSRQWLYRVQTRKESLSILLQRLDVTQVDKGAFFAQLDEAKIEPNRLIEAMLYNTLLIPLLSEYIGWSGLEQAAWYFIAHTTDSTTDLEKAKISEYSAIAIEDFERGSFDRKWFMDAYRAMVPSQFEVVYEAAKYGTSGANHRRAQLYARASLGELDAHTLRQEIEDKRNQDKLRAYSLLPVTIEEVNERYLYVQRFLKESKQFGAQRRASEALAVDMAIQNLAEQVAQGNTTQFIWQMENERFKELQVYFTPQTIEDVTLQLIQSEQGDITLTVKKGEKVLKSVPKKIAKHEAVLAIQDARKELMEQFKRARQQLERAMCEEAPFQSALIVTLSKNATFNALLSKLVWRQEGQFYKIDQGQFMTIADEIVSLSGEVQVAHSYHLYEGNIWREWQQHAFSQKWQQPFKQLFRELYLVTEDEVGKFSTNRYEGYQVQPKKAIALLKSRGWKTGYYEPIRKISYHYNTITVIDFVYDHLTPADVESPTLQDVTFVERLTKKPLMLEHVPAVAFSEVLRDLDLVVSVAHVGEVDPEASHSTTEMRAVIVEEIAALLQLNNVRVKQPHILIDGQLGQYSIHLGSGNVHQLGGAQIPVLAVPSQHRGRVFLPFVDDDPKTAEITAKMLLFAEDDQITDPKIRHYIRK